MLEWLKKLFGRGKPEGWGDKCDHIYSPVIGDNGKPIGQQCPLCGKFNSLAQVEAAWRRVRVK